MVARRLFRYLRPHRKELGWAVAALLAATGASVAGPVLIKWFIDDHLTPRKLDTEVLWGFAAGYLALYVISVVLTYFQLLSFHRIAQWVVQQLRVDVFAKVQRLGLSFFDRTSGGSLISRITNDTEAVKDLFVSVLSTFIQNIVFIIGAFVALFVLDVKLAAACLIILPLIGGVMQAYRHFSALSYRRVRQMVSEINAKLNETIQGMSIIQAFSQERRMRREFERSSMELYGAHMRNIRLAGLLLRPAVDAIYLIALIVVLTLFGIRSFDGVVSIGTMYAFLNLLERLFEPFIQIMLKLSQAQNAIISAERVFQLLDEDHLAPVKTGNETPVITRGRIEFRNVTFSYDGQQDVLRNISFAVEPGQTVALVGHTGSGKSSIINLLMRFYPLRQGEILIDGVPLTAYDDKELRRQMGLVLQDPFLFVGTVRENIRTGDPDITDERVEQAARFVQADAFIRRLPKGYETELGERGASLSSGQRQLLSFARTMAREPKILVLDEATAHVDTETEEAIQQALRNMRQGRTTIAVAHRLSTIQDADLILVLHRGEIVERGTHDELIARKGLYYKMYLLQQGMTEQVG
ncbi:ATP-binding cassette domain-containing protein [Polycladomyces sp. WAk]|uniref:ATP-binding cassette domain-containing protein n=1 Tax=Polycladomyces zharkentensis TaxID=2807616 RepID=A0ABS2WMT8_9BACL|nr:ABC transporter transmembrane domain-containing protein [Polycladomyces sp. WAk]MBN2910827.1 ATP-binding cassette domain-containing protein [Polycladomyces sp. WAk]